MTENQNKIMLISDLLSKEEIKSISESLNVEIEPVISDKNIRDITVLSDPVIVALITSVTSLTGIIIAQIVKIIIEKCKLSRKEGIITVKHKDVEVKIPFDCTENDFKQKLEMINQLKSADHIIITKITENQADV